MTTRAQQSAIVEKQTRQRARDYHRALDQASRDAEGIADITPIDNPDAAARRLAATANDVAAAHAIGGTLVARDLAIQLAGDALALAATLTMKGHA